MKFGVKPLTCLPNGHELYRADNNAGGHTYYSDEVGDGVVVWDTCLVDSSTLLAAILEEHRYQMIVAARRKPSSRSKTSHGSPSVPRKRGQSTNQHQDEGE